MSTTRIEWATHVWNPISGCDRVSDGCTNCYAATFARRHRAMGTRGYQRDGRPETSGPGFGVSLHDWTLKEPLRWRTRRDRIFVNSMSDAFHPEVPDTYLAALWSVMYWTGADVRGQYAHRPVQTYLILTKRPRRMRAWLAKWADRDTRLELIKAAAEHGWCDQEDIDNAPFMPGRLASVWLGVSVENQQTADTRIPQLMQTPAAVRFVSAEPLLGPVDLTRWLRPVPDCRHAAPDNGCCTSPGDMSLECHRAASRPLTASGQWHGLDWVIAGGESGPGARPMHPRWISDLRTACELAQVPYFFKQWGAWAPADPDLGRPDVVHIDPRGGVHGPAEADPPPAGSAPMARYGKKRAGSALGGRHYQQLPGHYTDRTERLLEQLNRCTTRTDHQVAVARRLLADHPNLPLLGFMVSHRADPAPGVPLHWLLLRVGEHDTDAITAWAKALGTEPVIDGARRTLTTAMNGIGIRASATIPEDAYDLEGAVFTPTHDDVTGTFRGLLMTEIGEDGDLLILGHPPARDVLALTSAYYRNICGQRLRPLHGDDLAGSIDRRWGRFVAYPTRADWTVRPASKETPGAVPITWMYARNADPQDLASRIERCPKCQRPSRGLDYDLSQARCLHICPSPACHHRWPTDSPTTGHTKEHP